MARRKHGHGDDHEGGHADERWLITYADMITLLMVLFIVLFAMSNIDQQKYISLAAGLAGSFSETRPNITAGGQGVGTPTVADNQQISIASEMKSYVNPAVGKELSGKTQTQTSATSSTTKPANDVAVVAKQAVLKDKNDLNDARRKIEAALKAAGIKSGVVLTQDDRGLTVTVINDLVFNADRAEVLPAGLRLLKILAPALIATGHKIRVEGHTNQVKVAPKYYPSEWELSSARASAVVRTLIGMGLNPPLMSAEGLADTQPLIPASDPRSVDLNRRVAIVVQSSVSDTQRTLSAFAPATT
jgi:chemotaxis protein MotB